MRARAVIPSGANLDGARSFNRRVVLETIRLNGPLSRADISRRSTLALQTISNIADELLQAGLIVETPRRPLTRGAPSTDLTLNPDGGFTIGISMDAEGLTALLVDLSGRVRAQLREPAEDATPDTMLPQVERLARRLLARLKIGRDRVWGAGLVLPALFEGGSLVSLGAGMPGWSGVHIAERLAAKMRMPVLVENDATAAAIGERLYGVGQALQDFFYVHFAAGLGGGLILAGHPHRGAGKAGELGHMVVQPGGRPCPCGNRGCLERYASLSAATAALTGLPEGGAPVSTERLLAGFEAGNHALLAWLDEAAAMLRIAIGNIENLLDPDAIVVGGIIPPPLLQALLARLEPLPPTLGARANRTVPRVLAATAGSDTPALGAAALPVFDGLVPSFGVLEKAVGAGPARLRVAQR